MDPRCPIPEVVVLGRRAVRHTLLLVYYPRKTRIEEVGLSGRFVETPQGVPLQAAIPY
jgi:hypothetical protein